VTELANVRTFRNDSAVSLEAPQEYFRYETPQAPVYRAPAIFTIIKDQTIRDEELNPNYVNSMCDIYVACVVQDRIQNNLTTKAWRYQAALMKILHQTTILSGDGFVKLFIRVKNCGFSGIINIKDDRLSDVIFRKEVNLRLQVNHIENLLT